MATAAMKARAHTGANGGTVVAPELVSMEFLIVEDNGGNYHWTLLDRDGNSLARSPSYASHEDAEDAALAVLAGAGSARLEPPRSDRQLARHPQQDEGSQRPPGTVTEQRDTSKQATEAPAATTA